MDVNRKGSLGDQDSVSRKKKRKAVMRKESAETQDYVSCHDMEVDNDKSQEEVGFVRSAVSDSAGRHDHLRVKHMCDKKCNEEAPILKNLAAIVWNMMSSPTRSTSVGTVSTESGETHVSNAVWKDMIRPKFS